MDMWGIIYIIGVVVFFTAIVLAEIYGRKRSRKQIIDGLKIALTTTFGALLFLALNHLVLSKFLDSHSIGNISLSTILDVLFCLLIFVALINKRRKRVALEKAERNETYNL